MSNRILAITGAIGLGSTIGRYLIASGTDLATVTIRLCNNLTTALSHPTQTLLFMTASVLTALALTRTHSSRLRDLLASYITASITLFVLILITMSPMHPLTFAHKGSAAHILSQRTGWVTSTSPDGLNNGSKRFTFNESAYFLFSPPPATPPIFIHQGSRTVIPAVSLSSLLPAEVAKTHNKLASDGDTATRIFTDGSAYLLVNPSAEEIDVECFE
jgi:hypothetical protein